MSVPADSARSREAGAARRHPETDRELLERAVRNMMRIFGVSEARARLETWEALQGVASPRMELEQMVAEQELVLRVGPRRIAQVMGISLEAEVPRRESGPVE